MSDEPWKFFAYTAQSFKILYHTEHNMSFCMYLYLNTQITVYLGLGKVLNEGYYICSVISTPFFQMSGKFWFLGAL